MGLFVAGSFTLHSGGRSNWLIDCSALSPEDWQTLALMAVEARGEPFGEVVGVPRGGLPFAEALRAHVTPGCDTVLLADDVLTTGASMRDAYERARGRTLGVVVFARGLCPPWVMPLFRWVWNARPPEVE